MNIVAKIFTVLNLVIAICFMMVSLTLYAKRVNWVDQANKSVVERNALNKAKLELEKDIEALKRKNVDVVKNLKSERDNYQIAAEKEAASNKKNDLLIVKLTGDTSKISTELQHLTQQIEQAKKTNMELVAAKEEAIKEKTKADNEREFAESRAIEIMADLKEGEDELRQLAKNNASLVGSVAKLNAALQKISDETGVDPLKVVAPAKAIYGSVIRVEEAIGIVILNIGEKDSVKKGMEFVISDGDEYIGKVKVRNIYEDMCSASVITGLQKKPMAINQTAQTL